MQEWLTPIIKSKDKLQENWTNNYDEKLLIISVGLSRSGDINLERLVLSEETGLKKWDKIVLIDIHFSKYLEINAT